MIGRQSWPEEPKAMFAGIDFSEGNFTIVYWICFDSKTGKTLHFPRVLK